MIITPQLIVETARTWVGTKYQHQRRIKGVAVDCAGLAAGVAKELGFAIEDFTAYQREPNPGEMKHYLDINLVRVQKDEMQIGDIAWIRFAKNPQHLGIIGNYEHGGFSLIHASNALAEQRVVEHRLDDVWLARIAGLWRYPGA